MIVLIIHTIIFYYCTRKLLKLNKMNREIPFLTHSKNRHSKGVNYYAINVQTKSNIINLQEPCALSYNSNEIYDSFEQENLKIVYLETCQFCGAITNGGAFYCYYCGNEIKI